MSIATPFNTIHQSKRILGVMSGTSMDGIDFALVDFTETDGQIHYAVLAAHTFPYPLEWINQLKEAERCSGARLAELHTAYGGLTGKMARDFLLQHNQQAELLCMHGHTIFHQPQKGFSFQLGSGAAAAVNAGIPVVSDFRSVDIAHGGQGAPLVPIGDQLLFPTAQSCLNLGGFANVSICKNDRYIAWDICAVNYVLNRLANREGLVFDRDGALARSGRLLPEVLQQINALPQFSMTPPKSLAREWVEQEVMPLLPDTLKTADLLHTFSHHIAMQIAAALDTSTAVLITGGGAHNRFLIELLRNYSSINITISDHLTVDFKEAIIFALLGWLRVRHRPNALQSVTGANQDSCGGAIYLP
jgi:anhydro-N-acetylmuramic acid kinase